MKTDQHSVPIVLRGPLRDVWRFLAHLGERRRRIRNSSPHPPVEGTVSRLARILHPDSQDLVVRRVDSPVEGTKIYHLGGAGDLDPAPYKAGTYVSVQATDSADRRGSRPYSLCSTPAEARRSGEYMICVKETDPGFVSKEILATWAVGSPVTVSDPQGFFCYEPLRDGDELVFVAGGSGITPFRSLVEDILDHHQEVHINLFHGARRQEGLLFRDYFESLSSTRKEAFAYWPVLSEEEHPDYRFGLIGSALIKEVLNRPATAAFLCGPPGLHAHLDRELVNLTGLIRRIRREDYGSSGMPVSTEPQVLTVRIDEQEHRIPANTGETVLVAMERAGLNPPSSCRTGTCGYCRSRLLAGRVVYDEDHQGLRAADRLLGYFHPCVALPASDMTIEIPSRPLS